MLLYCDLHKALKNLIIANKQNYQWIAYLSSTGVYGDHQGAWVDETSPCHANTERAMNRLLAEKAWLSLYETEALPVMIFRLSGIYGPGRNAIERLRSGKDTTVFKKGHVKAVLNFLPKLLMSVKVILGLMTTISQQH